MSLPKAHHANRIRPLIDTFFTDLFDRAAKLSQNENMKYMVSWKISCENHQAAGEAFLKSGAPTPEGVELLGRWHGPGSVQGWGLIESSDPQAVYEHAAQWASMLELQVTPVLDDAEGGEALSRVYGA